MSAPWSLWDSDPRLLFQHVLRGRDAIIHVVGVPIAPMIKIRKNGIVVSDDDAHIIVTTCGLRVKMNIGGRNRYTEQAATCLACVAGGYPDES